MCGREDREVRPNRGNDQQAVLMSMVAVAVSSTPIILCKATGKRLSAQRSVLPIRFGVLSRSAPRCGNSFASGLLRELLKNPRPRARWAASRARLNHLQPRQHPRWRLLFAKGHPLTPPRSWSYRQFRERRRAGTRPRHDQKFNLGQMNLNPPLHAISRQLPFWSLNDHPNSMAVAMADPDSYPARRDTMLARTGTDLIVTNLHRRFTGVTATTAAVASRQQHKYKMLLAGRTLPGCKRPSSLSQAFLWSRYPAPGHRYVLWHVRRNNEMRAALFARDVLKLPIRIVFTSAAQRRHSAFPRWLISRMDAVIATTSVAASFVPNVHAVIPHGVDTERFYPAEDRQQAWRQLGYPGKFGIATIGRIRSEKGTDLFVEAMIHVLSQNSDATALIVGRCAPSQRAYQNDLQRRIAAAGLTHRMLFVGEKPWTQLPPLMRALSLLVASPRYEGYGLTPLEAMASGVPVVATETGHFSAFIGKNEAGILVKSSDPSQIANAVTGLVDHPIEMNKKRVAARSRALNLFDVSSEVGGIHEVYEKLWT